MENRSKIDQWRIAEYKAIRDEMQSITIARYAVLAFTITAIAVILAAMLSIRPQLDTQETVLIAPISLTAILLPSIVVNLRLSTQYHRLSAFNAIFGQPMLQQQEAFEIYKKKRPHFWGYVKPLAFTYTWLLALTAIAFLVLFWSCQMLVAVLLMVGVHMWPLAKLWDAGLTGKTREAELKLWSEIKDELTQSYDE